MGDPRERFPCNDLLKGPLAQSPTPCPTPSSAGRNSQCSTCIHWKRMVNLSGILFFLAASLSQILVADAFHSPQINHSHYASRSKLFREIEKTSPRSGLFSRVGQQSAGIGDKRRMAWGNAARKSSSTALNMVFTTSSSLIEKISTKILLDDLIDESVRTAARNPVMMQFDPSSGWIWRRWKGTIFSETWRRAVTNICIATVIWTMLSYNRVTFLQNLSGFNILWGQLLSVTTFTLTFFLNQSYTLWRNCYGFSRRLQGRLNDLSMTLAAHATRCEPIVEEVSEEKKPSFNSNFWANANGATNGEAESSAVNGDDPCELQENEKLVSVYTEPARQILELMARYTRVFNLLTYASFTGSHRPLLTPQGMRRLVDRGILTETERQVLSEAQVPVTQRHNMLLLWIIRLFLDARKAGHIEGSDGFEQQFLEKCHVIRSQYGAIGDELAGRMPLAYAHIVQVLVDVILWMYPFMAFSQGMTPFLGVLGTGILTMFYQGLFDLAKQFLDPYDNESYGKGEDPLCIDTLIAESNAGSVRWMNGLAEKPFVLDKIEKGQMEDYQLPLRGWTVEETYDREEEERLRLAQLEVEQAAAAMEKIEETPPPLIVEPEVEDTEDIDLDMDDIDTCDVEGLDENLTMEEALEKMDECTEKVP